MNNLHYLLALNRLEKVGSRTLLKLLKRWPELSDLFHLSESDLLQQGLPTALAQAIRGIDFTAIEEDFRWLEQSSQHHILHYGAANYPALLQELADPPAILYAVGDLQALNTKTLAVVGSRNPSITGSENAKHFSRELAKRGLTIVSGLAIGIDSQAHLGCLEASGRTIAVLGTGIDCIYPRRNYPLARKITENGLLLSEFPLKSPPIAGHFPRRNRIISGLSLCTLVIEAAIKSGSLITARMALEQNRDVLAIPGSIHNPLARGCHYLLQQGAKLVTSISDVLDELQLGFVQDLGDSSTISLASKTENLVKFIGFESTSTDQILTRSGYTLDKVLYELARLELQGTIKSVPGGYIRC